MIEWVPRLGPTSLGFGGNAATFDGSDVLRVDAFSSFHQVDQVDGSTSAPLSLGGTGWFNLCSPRLEAADLDEESGDIWGIGRGGGSSHYLGCGGGAPIDVLVRIDPSTAATSVIGTLGFTAGNLVAVPEPGALPALGGGSALLAVLAWRRGPSGRS